ncbi:MAG TPA: Hsp20/alpha crystallin family protein [Caldithrix abyssi]|uniref:Hsp20/alpha crystallin family protein n=1 Tax=Caldithrix abyssi TaxID=187145 RepID=A0A7V4WU98_CALAY|nr:Hsp20/alpha crystallin family protein [Caldithrix abyssi]
MLTRWSPARSLFTLKTDMDRLFDEFFRTGMEVTDRVDLTPLVDVEENDDEFVISAELPGMKRDDIKITFDNNMLNISGEKKAEKEMKEENFHRMERSYGKFSRTIPIPSGVKLDKIDAVYEDGVLTVHIPKTEEAKPKQIEIKVK